MSQEILPSAQNTKEYLEQVFEAAEYVKSKIGTASIALVLGSGLKQFITVLKDPIELPYSEIPHMPVTTVVGHPGKLVSGTVRNKRILVLAGRSHPYEGMHMYQLTFTARVMSYLGVKLFIASNASGGTLLGMEEGCLMIIKDHINLFHRNPLADTMDLTTDDNQQNRPDFGKHPIYNKSLRALANQIGKEKKINIFEGIYGSTCGPTYETPSEVRLGIEMDVSAFGMSTVSETMTSKLMGLEVFAVSLITNLAAGLKDEVLTHGAVEQVAIAAGGMFCDFMEDFIEKLDIDNLETNSSNFHGKVENVSQITQSSMLPKVGVLSAPNSAIDASVKKLIDGLSTDITINGALVFGSQKIWNQFKDKITIEKSIKISELPDFPALTDSGKVGEISIGKFKNDENTRILFLHHLTWDLFSCEESTFLSRVFYKLSLKYMVHVLVLQEISGSENQNNKKNKIFCVTDGIDFTTITPIPRNFEQLENCQYFAKNLFGSAVENNGVGNGAVMTIPGPSLPTLAELDVAKKLGANLVGVSNLGLASAVTSVGINNFGLAVGTADLSDVPEDQESLGLLFEILGKLVEREEKSEKLKVNLTEKSLTDNRQISYHLPQPVTQGDFATTEKIVQFIRESIAPTTKSSTVFGVWMDDLVFANMYKTTPEAFKEVSGIPHPEGWNAGLHKLFLWTGVERAEEIVLVCVSKAYLNSGITHAEATLPIRILKGLGTHTILFVSPVVGGAGDKVGEVGIVGDHVNWSGRNPLFGLNESRWGTRFPDMGDGYWKEGTQALKKYLEGKGGARKDFVVNYVLGPLFNGHLADKVKKWKHKEGTEGVVWSGLVPEVLTARHVNVNVVVLGVVIAGGEGAVNWEEVKEQVETVVGKRADWVPKTNQ